MEKSQSAKAAPIEQRREQEEEKSSLWERTVGWVDDKTDGDFSLHGLHNRLMGILATTITVASFGVAVADETLGLHIGRDMAGVVVEKQSNVLFRTVEEAARDIGKEAKQYER